MLFHLMVGHLGCATLTSVGAIDLERLQYALHCEAPIVSCGDGTHLALFLFQELLIADGTQNMTSSTL
jgi:hypothetical protein